MLQPIGGKIAVKPDADIEKIGSIHIPSNASEDVRKRYRGTVIAVGPGKRIEKKVEGGKRILLDGREEMPVKVGDVVYWTDRGGFLTDKVKWNDEEVIIMNSDDLMAKEV